uniref:Uncharacterized protein n=1 Tax=Euplotes harpa TaxID=151035 RepID=A0A7S3JK12_9SPIT|mmetsp:Transcript_41523/g.47900  ORF Transcript_41523/g.47900 Transcript_41523/m.47900 type:complete len:140 (+) Transcript_41523:547-966(+)
MSGEKEIESKEVIKSILENKSEFMMLKRTLKYTYACTLNTEEDKNDDGEVVQIVKVNGYKLDQAINCISNHPICKKASSISRMYPDYWTNVKILQQDEQKMFEIKLKPTSSEFKKIAKALKSTVDTTKFSKFEVVCISR